jgi:hypothetical protein
LPKEVPAEGFSSVTVYNQNRFMVRNEYDAYALNNLTSENREGGSTVLHFRGDPNADSCNSIMDG